MKAILSILLLAILGSCEVSERKKYPFTVTQITGTGLSQICTSVACDSVIMESQNVAVAWQNGAKIRIVGNQINVESNIRTK